jgi:hypothetical protein
MQSNTTGVTSGTGTAYPTRTPDLTPIFSGARVNTNNLNNTLTPTKQMDVKTNRTSFFTRNRGHHNKELEI